MKRLLAVMLAFVATGQVAHAQPRTEPRLAGGPERVCTEAEIRQALDGSYAGPPCRFTEMPTRPQAVSAAPSQAVHGRPADHRMANAQPAPVRRAAVSVQQPVLASRQQGNSFIASQQSSGTRTQTPVRQWPPQASTFIPATPARHSANRRVDRPANHAGETVHLSDGFFSGALVGGVERPYAPVYSYRGMILIAADGEVRTGHSALEHRVMQVRALDNRSAPVPHPAPRRAYP